jgi:hypothetical protein
MNNIIGELFPKIMGGYFKLELPPQRQQPYSDELFSQSSQAIQTGTVIYDFAADRNAYQADVVLCDGGNRTYACSLLGLRCFPGCPTSKPCISTN